MTIHDPSWRAGVRAVAVLLIGLGDILDDDSTPAYPGDSGGPMAMSAVADAAQPSLDLDDPGEEATGRMQFAAVAH